MVNTLDFRWVEINNKEANKRSGKYLDFLVSGRSLKELLNIVDSEHVTLLGEWFSFTNVNNFIEQLKGNHKERVEFYVCPHCGDIDCGAITADVTKKNNKVYWHNFTHGTSSEIFTSYSLPPIEFNYDDYITSLSKI